MIFRKNNKRGGFFSVKSILLAAIIINVGYLCSMFPEEVVLICGGGAIIVIGIWLFELEKQK